MIRALGVIRSTASTTQSIARMDEVAGGRFGQKGVMAGDLTAGIDAPDALGENVYLGPAIFAFEGGNLAVGIGDADVVQVNESQPADARTRQGLDDP